MNRRTFATLAGIGILVVLLLVLGLGAVFANAAVQQGRGPGIVAQQVAQVGQALPTLSAPAATTPAATGTLQPGSASLNPLYEQVNPGVVNIDVVMQRGDATGSGFLIDTQGHIITNNHVVAGATQVVVSFYDGTQEQAKIVGTDPSSDLAVIQVATIPGNVHPLPLGDSTKVKPGDWVVAIGSPFGLGSSMTTGIVSAVGRSIPSGVTAFSIPEAIQTDAAINPGNSGGPLLNMQGEVIGVNAQIESGGTGANSGVGFAIPVNFVRKIAPALIQNGHYAWPYLGVQGASVDLFLQQANNLSNQQGAYIDQVVPGGPAAQAGLRGSTGSRTLSGNEVPTGGDVVVAVDGNAVHSFNDLLGYVATKGPGDRIQLTVLRNGSTQQVTVQLGERPAQVAPTGQQ